jgi:hypothetical protein
MNAPLTHAKAGETPADWWAYVVIDAATGEPIERVVEANAAEGGLVRYQADEQGFLRSDGEGKLLTERLEQPIRLVRAADPLGDPPAAAAAERPVAELTDAELQAEADRTSRLLVDDVESDAGDGDRNAILSRLDAVAAEQHRRAG